MLLYVWQIKKPRKHLNFNQRGANIVMMLNNTLLQMPDVGEETGAYWMQNPPNRSNSPCRATETTIYNWSRLTFILRFNLDIPRNKFTILRLFNILPYISLYFKQTTRHYQLQVHKNPMKYLWKTHESFFRAMNIAFPNFHGLIEAH